MIRELLKTGRKNAVSKAEIKAQTGLSDRDIFSQIETENRKNPKCPIVSDGSGGLFIADVYDEHDQEAVRKAAHKRFMMGVSNIKAARALDASVSDIIIGQMELHFDE